MIQNDLLGLDITFNGTPFVRFSSVDTLGLDVTFNGTPFLVPITSGTPPVVTYNATQFFAMF